MVTADKEVRLTLHGPGMKSYITETPEAWLDILVSAVLGARMVNDKDTEIAARRILRAVGKCA